MDFGKAGAGTGIVFDSTASVRHASVLTRSDLNEVKVRFRLHKAEDEGVLAPVEDGNAVQAEYGEGLV